MLAVPRVSDHDCVGGAGACQLARQSDLHVFRADAGQPERMQDSRVGQERVHDKLKRAHHTANGAADRHHHFSNLEDRRGPACSNLDPEQVQNESCKTSGEPVVPHRGILLPTLARDSLWVAALQTLPSTSEMPKIVPTSAVGTVPDVIDSSFLV